MGRFAVLILAAVTVACGSPTGPGRSVAFVVDFVAGPQEWLAGFADYRPGEEALFELDSGYRPLPAPLDTRGSALFISGKNLSDDLLMFYKRRITLPASAARYAARFEVEFATDVPRGCGGVGGSPGESVWLKAGASGAEPVTTVQEGTLRLSTDIGGQANDGRDGIVLGTIENSVPCEVRDGEIVRRWELKTLRSGEKTVHVRSGGDGAVWLLVGTDSGFEATTSLYYTRVVATFTRE
jgi:hypothetical protein